MNATGQDFLAGEPNRDFVLRPERGDGGGMAPGEAVFRPPPSAKALPRGVVGRRGNPGGPV